MSDEDGFPPKARGNDLAILWSSRWFQVFQIFQVFQMVPDSSFSLL
jgi:hypothetical protein